MPNPFEMYCELVSQMNIVRQKQLSTKPAKLISQTDKSIQMSSAFRKMEEKKHSVLMRMKAFSLHPQGDSEVKTSGTSPRKILEQGTPAAGQKYSKPSACTYPI